MNDFQVIASVDPEIAHVLELELKRQREHLELIASENFVSDAVLATAGTHLTNKYAEGYPGKRYYGGCAHVDQAEDLARERAKQIFGAEHANVPAAFGRAGQHRGLFCAARPRRHHPRDEPFAWRPSDARQPR